jgi:hypothetical protein
MPSLSNLRGKMGKVQSNALDEILNSPARLRAGQTSSPFPKKPPFVDTLQPERVMGLNEMLSVIEVSVISNKARLARLAVQLHDIDQLYAKRDVEAGKLPREVSAELCVLHGLNWMFIAPMVNAFKK